MNEPERREEVVFEAALRLTAHERAAYLDQTCGGNTELRRRVDALLGAFERAGGFLKEPAMPAHARTVAVSLPPTGKPGDRIGRYKLLEQIGEGGCGIVYMALQEEPVRRQVALKIIKLGMDTRNVIARFEAERQALALMEHPNIAKVFDAGATDTGRPFFVMELVRGTRITDYCDENRLPTRQRLDLFVQVCHAIQHAHQKGIIHRDIKPSNILVTMRDGVPVPKVIDFGIAKATTDQLLTDKTVFTEFQQFLGTPAYMSPEQAEMSELGIDTRSDIYSLGILLYELLTGKTPFEAKDLLRAGIDEIRRIIREQEPVRPSARLSTMQADELTATAWQRHAEPPRLVSLVRGDLDWIVLRTLEKDRARRYETANGLAMDVQRYLDDEPVVACPPSRVYRLRKAARRHKLAFAAAAAVSLTLVVGLAVSTWFFAKERRAHHRALAAEQAQVRLRQEAEAARASEAAQRRRAEQARAEEANLRQQAEAEQKKAQTEAAKSRQVAQFLKEILEGVGPSKALGRDTTMLREILDKTAERAGQELTNQPEVEVEVRLTLAATYDELGFYQQMEAMARQSLQVARARLGDENESVANSLSRLGDALSHLGNLGEAEKYNREALAMFRRLSGDEHSNVAASLNNLAIVLEDQGRLVEAETIQRQALGMKRKLLGREHPRVAGSLNNLAGLLDLEGKLAEAETVQREALAMQRKLLGNEHPDVANSLRNLADMLHQESKLAEAETMYREALVMQRKLLGNEHPDVAASLNNLANVLKQEGKLAEAETMQREALAIERKLLGNEHRNVASSLNNLANVLLDENKLPEAETMNREALGMRRKLLGNEHPDVASSLNNLGIVLSGEGKLAEAEATYREALSVSRKASTVDPSQEIPSLGVALHHLADVLGQRKALTEARLLAEEAAGLYQRHLDWPVGEREHAFQVLGLVLTELDDLGSLENWLRQAVEAERTVSTNGPSGLESAVADLAALLRREKKYAEAEPYWREALTIARKFATNDAPRLESRLADLADCLRSQKRYDESLVLYRGALASAWYTATNDASRFEVRVNDLAGVLWTQGKLAEAETTYREALPVERKMLGNEHPDIAASLQTLADLLSQEGKLTEAEASYREALGIRRKSVGSEGPGTAGSAHNLADVLRREGKLAEAESLYREALAARRKVLGNEDPATAGSRRNLTDLLQDEGRSSEAETLLREELATARQSATNEPSKWVGVVSELAGVLQREGKTHAVEQLFNDILPASWQGQTASVSLLSARADFFARRGRWKEAAADMACLVQLEPTNHWNYHCLAPLLVQVPDVNGYQAHCRRTVLQFRGTEYPNIAERMAKDCLLLPDSGVDFSTVSAWADTAVAAGKESSDLPWFQLCKGLAEYRQGRFMSAANWTQKVLAHASANLERDVQAYMVLSMAQYRSKQAAEASAALAKGVEIAERKLPKLDGGDLGDGWLDLIIAHTLMREAKALIEGKAAADTENKPETR